MLVAELFEYISSLGGKEYKGFVVLAYSAAAIISRPISGNLTDNLGRKPVMLIGIALCFISAFLYPFASSILFFFSVRILHGISAAFTPSANSAALIDITPLSRRGEAIGIVSFFASIGMTVGPYFGSEIKINLGYNFLFFSSCFFSLIALLIVLSFKETLENNNKKIRMSSINFFNISVMYPALVYLFYMISYTIIFTIIPDFSTHLNIENKGLFFLYCVGTSCIIRIFVGRISDKIGGRFQFLFFGILILLISMFLIGSAKDVTTFLIGAILNGISIGVVSPVIMAWASEVASTKHLGSAFSTMFLCLEIGVSLAAIFSSLIYKNNSDNFSSTFYFMSLFGFIALIIIVYIKIYKNHVFYAKTP